MGGHGDQRALVGQVSAIRAWLAVGLEHDVGAPLVHADVVEKTGASEQVTQKRRERHCKKWGLVWYTWPVSDWTEPWV